GTFKLNNIIAFLDYNKLQIDGCVDKILKTDYEKEFSAYGWYVQRINGHDFEEIFSALIGALKAAAGHTTSTLWKDVSDDASYLITSEWSDEQAFQDFIHSTAFRDVTNWGKEQILSGRPQHKIYKH
ncbi:MAG: antibiotic biosynthesis monooxygenase, partial [Planctomycetales bacterium]|nr:antibiotic biosynthesis monooxygenase [Planctomycetales bacterium]